MLKRGQQLEENGSSTSAAAKRRRVEGLKIEFCVVGTL
jgi:hypothetical protein